MYLCEMHERRCVIKFLKNKQRNVSLCVRCAKRTLIKLHLLFVFLPLLVFENYANSLKSIAYDDI